MARKILTVLAALICMSASAWAQSAGAEPTVPLTPVIGANEQHLRRATERSMAEVALGRLAQERAAADAVRRFADEMVQAHSDLSQGLRTVAGRLGYDAPQDLHRDTLALLERLESLEGPAFDQVYVRDRAQDRMRHLNLMLKLEAQADEPELRALAEQWVPVLNAQLEKAQDLRVAVRPIVGGPVGAVPTQEAPPTAVLPDVPEEAYSDTAEGKLSP